MGADKLLTQTIIWYLGDDQLLVGNSSLIVGTLK